MSIHGGAATLINTYTTGLQYYVQKIATLADGGWVVTWKSDGQDGDGSGVYQQAYNPDGTVRGVETRVHDHTEGDQHTQSILALPDGGWIVTWSTYVTGGDIGDVFLQAFNADGSKRGSETLVNSTTADDQSSSSIALLADGGWVVTWNSGPEFGEPTETGQDGSGFGVFQQVFNEDGTARGGEVQVNTYTQDYQQVAQVTSLAGGGWVVIWISNGQDGSLTGVYQQAYDASGVAVGGETQVNTSTPDRQQGHNAVALSDGGWVVIWTDSGGEDGAGRGVFQQMYNADGTARGSETQVNTYTDSDQGIRKALAALPDGGWIIIWDSAGQDHDDGLGGIYQQVFNADGTARGSETQVNTYTPSYQVNADITVLSDGGWVVVWQSNEQDGNAGGIYLQVFNADGTRNGHETRVNNHTNGDQAIPVITAIEDGGFVVSWSSHGPQGDMIDVYQKIFRVVDDLTLVGNGGKNKLFGGLGEDTLNGRGGHDTLKGFDGNDQLLGANGKDQLFGGGGGDVLEGGKGRDILKGQAGLDIFVFNKRDGKDKLLGFKNGQDQFDFQSMGYKNKAQALNHFYEIGGKNNNKVGFDHKGVEIVVTGLDLKDINGSDVLV